MTDQQLLTIWFAGLGVFMLVILIAAILLIAVLLSARRIELGAGAALGLVTQIRDNTNVIWKLQDTNVVAGQLLGGAKAILKDAGQIAQALHEADVKQGRARP